MNCYCTGRPVREMIDSILSGFTKIGTVVLVLIGVISEAMANHWVSILTLIMLAIAHVIRLWMEWHWKQKTFDRESKRGKND